MKSSVSQNIAIKLDHLLGKKCWRVSAGPGTGSMFSLDFGRKICCSKPLNNPKLTHDQNHNEGQMCIFVEFAAWRLDRLNKVLCSSTTDNRKDGPMVRNLNKLVGKVVAKVIVLTLAQDLELHFTNGYVLRLFCDQANEIEDHDNYSMKLDNTWYVVKSWGKIKQEETLK